MTIILPVRNQMGLTTLLGELYNPSSPMYRHFLSVQQFTDQFSPSEQDYQSVIQWANNNGLIINGQSKNRLTLDVSGTAGQVNAALNVSMNMYQDPDTKRSFYSIDREPTLNLNVPIAHIEGLNNFSIPHPMVKVAKNVAPIANITGSGPGGYYLGSDMRAVYYGGTLLTGAGQSVGLFEFGGYRLSDVNLTFNNAGQSYSVPINNVLLDGATAAAGSDDSEQVLDIAQAIGMAPGLSQVRVYIGVSGHDADIFNSMATENICKQLSVSWSWSPDDPWSDDSIFQEFAAQGQSIFVASGDSGAYDAAISPYFYPAEDAYVTAVGGTHLVTNYGGGPWAAETAWNNPPYGSGGGISPDEILMPSWQQGIATYSNGGSAYLRNVPDVSMEADLDNYSCDMGTCGGGIGGTSFAAPRWAGVMALINQQATETGAAPSGGLGFINPAIYSIGEGSNYGGDLHDITSGNNDTGNQPVWYNATTGYDLVTGWGSPNRQNLIDTLAGSVIPGFWLSSSPASLALSQGSSTTTTISVTDAGGFSGNVSLAASGLPSGVTASFNPGTTAGTSVLTLTATSSATLGTATITITGTSGSLKSTTTLFLTVNSPSTPPPPNEGFGPVNIGSASTPSTLTLTFAASGTLSSITVLTQGVANLDFTNAGGGTCAIGTAYAANATCTVNVTFTPRYSGARYGGVVLADASGNQLANLYLEGTGVGPQTTFTPGTQTTIGTGIISPVATAMLGDGSVYVTDYGNGNGTGALYLEKLSSGSYTQSKVNCTFTTPAGIAVDGAGTIYVADPGVPTVYKVVISNGNCSRTTIGSGFGTPWGVAVDGSGDVYITDLGTSSVAAAVYKETLQVNGSYVQSAVGTGWLVPTAVAVDGSGNIDVADYAIPGVFMETPFGGSYTQTAIGEGWTAPSGIAVDGSGNIYVSDAGNSLQYGEGSAPAAVFKEVPSGGSYVGTPIGSGWVLPDGVAVDASGNIYVADNLRGVYKEDLADPPALGFVNAVAGAVSTDSPKSVTVSNLGTGALQFSSVAYPTDFPEAAGISTDCTSNTSLAARGSCTLSIEFLPTTALGTNTSLALNERVTITTNTLNTTASQQAVAAGGTEVLPSVSLMLNASSDPAVVGTPITFTATVAASMSGPTPTGTVTFYSGSTPISGPLALSNGVATYSTNSLAVGTYAILASYSGDANYLASTSNTITESVIAAPGASGFGNASIGTQNIGSTSNVIPLTITFSTAETLGSISVLTEGVPNMDFANAGGGTCAIGTAYASNSSCTVNVTFTPKYSGTRSGAVVLFDNSGDVIGTGYLAGTGVGPQTVFLPGSLSSLASGFGYPQGVAVDGSSNLYVADALNATVYKETLSNGVYSQSTLGSGFSQPYGVTVDGAGNIYVADVGSHAVYKETPSNGSYVQTMIGYGFISPMGVAVDALGNVYVADFGNGVTPGGVYLETLSNGSYTQSTIGSGFVTPQSVAVDGSGNVYVADSANGNETATVYKLTPANGSYTQTTIGTGWVTPTGIAVDGNENVYVTDDAYSEGNGFVVKESLQSDGSYGQSTVSTATNTPYPGGVAVDGRGNLYVTDNFDGVLYRDDLADPPTLSFATTISGSKSSDSPKTVSVENAGNANLVFSALSYPSDFPKAAGIPTDCTSSMLLGAGTACTLSIDFTPASLNSTSQPILLSENITITTNSLNAGTTAQAIAVSGTEAAPAATVTLTVPANVVTVGNIVTFTGTVTGPTGITTPTGSITFYSNGTALGTSTLNNGVAAYSTNSLSVGAYNITATYSGDQVYPSATSNVIEEQIIPASAFGTQNVGSARSSTFTITFPKRVTLGSFAVVTEGMPNLDFTNAGGGTCTAGKAYASGATCTINVAFSPRFSGIRYGAIVLGDSKGNLLQTVYLQGTGIGPQVNFLPGTQTSIGSEFLYPCGYIVDNDGDLYICLDAGSGVYQISKWTLNNGTYSQSMVPTSTLSGEDALAVDAAGNVYIADDLNNRILKETLIAGSYAESTIGTGWNHPMAIAVDGNGNVYIVDWPSAGFRASKATPSSGSYIQTTIPTSQLGGSRDVLAVDSVGNVYISDLAQYISNGGVHNLDRLLKETPNGGTYTETTIESNTDGPFYDIVLDGNGNIYTSQIRGELQKVTPSGNGYSLSSVDIGATLWGSGDLLAVSGSGDLYVADCCDPANSSYTRILRVSASVPPTLTFASTNTGSTSSDSPRALTVENVGNATLAFPTPSTGTNPSISPNFSLDSKSTSCPEVAATGNSATLYANSSCTYGVNFVPTFSGSISGSLVLTDNSLNAVNGTQTSALNGTGSTNGQIAILTVGPSGSAHVTWLPNGTALANAATSGEKVWVDTDGPTFVVGIAEFVQGTCTEIGPGSLSKVSDLLGGTILPGYGEYKLPNNQCPGNVYQFAATSYTWGSNQASLQDPFTLAWTEPNGQPGGTLSFNAQLARIAVMSATQSSPTSPLTATASLINYPATATSYTWTITGGGGTIVFLNGKQSISSTTASITIQEPHPTTSSVSFKIGVTAVAPGSHPLEYGLLDVVFPGVPAITGNFHDIWYFGQGITSQSSGATQFSYSATLTAIGSGSAIWKVTSGGSEIKLTPNGNTATVISSGSAFSQTKLDVNITVTMNGLTSAPYQVTTHVPSTMSFTSYTHQCNPNYGYSDVINYDVYDQLGTNMSSVYSFDFNEKFTSGWVNVNGSNWVGSSEGPATNQTVSDSITGYGVDNVPAPIPTPVCSGNDTEAQYVPQQWYVGSLVAGKGVLLQTDQLTRYADKGAHVNPEP